MENTDAETSNVQNHSSRWAFTGSSGPHIVLLSICCSPLVFTCAVFYNAYLGVLTWYNIFLHFYDEKTFLHRVTLCPLLIFIFPPALLLAVLVISVYTAVKQISWDIYRWKYDVCDLERGAYAKLCLKIGLQQCCPYETVIMQTDEFDNVETTKENTSLQPSPQHS